MARERHTPEEIIGKQRARMVALVTGRSAKQFNREIGATERICSGRRTEYAGPRLDPARRRVAFARPVVRLIGAGFALSLVAVSSTNAQVGPAPAPHRQLSLENKPWRGDFDAMLERRVVRMLVPYSRTLYFVDKGRERGLTADLARDFEQYLNTKYASKLGKRPVTVFLIPTTRDKLFSGVVDGLGDIAAGNLTVTDERQKIVDFVAPADHEPMQELLVTGPSSPPVAALADLSGKTLHMRTASSYYESVLALNQHLKDQGKPPAAIVDLPAPLEDEDILEMLNAGLVDFTVTDDWKARMWAQVLPKIRVRDSLVLRAEAYPGWAVRKGSPQLVAVATAFYKSATKLQSREARLAQYYRRIKQISNNTQGASWKRFEATLKLFQKYGAKYHFDTLMLAAQGYQESKLQQDARSHMGAIGVMQIMPATGAELKVGDITHLEPNIHGGAKYMNRLMTSYFPDAKFDEAERSLFAFASYNAGPGNISRMRKLAISRGLDGDQWFNNVEVVVAQKIGIETTTYVRNIYKYYVAYKLEEAAKEATRKAKEEVRRQP
jgi:membrane-bound lytic murein transglycosylase MltF